MILAACGLRREARIVGRGGVVAVPGGGDAAGLERALETRSGEARAVLSIGLAGGLAEGLRVGDWVIGTHVLPATEEQRSGPDAPTQQGGHPAVPQASARPAGEREWHEELRALLPGAHSGPIHADGGAIATVAHKHALAATGAIAVDMESHIAARVAAQHGLPFAILRVISDEAGHALPPAALVGMKPDGGMAIGAVLASLARRPAQLPALLRTARDAETAFRSLLRGYDALLRVGLGLPDLGQRPLDMG